MLLTTPGMTEPDVVLVALDTSDRAPLVLEAAVQIALSRGAPLVLFRAVSLPPDVPPEAYGVSPNALVDVLRAKARARLDVLLRDLPSQLQASIDVAIATPWRGILDAADRHKANLIVLGSHGYDAIDRVLGTTAAKVVNRAHCSVLVVR